jgi:hypothetical protein
MFDRAAITHNILLRTHSLKIAAMLTEFRAGVVAVKATFAATARGMLL